MKNLFTVFMALGLFASANGYAAAKVCKNLTADNRGAKSVECAKLSGLAQRKCLKGSDEDAVESKTAR